MVNSAVLVVDGQIGHVTPPVDKQGIWSVTGAVFLEDASLNRSLGQLVMVNHAVS